MVNDHWSSLEFVISSTDICVNKILKIICEYILIQRLSSWFKNGYDKNATERMRYITKRTIFCDNYIYKLKMANFDFALIFIAS